MKIDDFFNVGYNPRFFYFKSLLREDNPNARALVSSVKDQMDVLTRGKINDDKFLQATKAGIELLNNMYIFEKQNEIRLIEEKIKPLANKYKNGKYSKLADCVKDNEIDYDSFVTLLQELSDDSKATQQQLNDLYKTMKDYQEIAEVVLKKLKITNFTEFENQRRSITGSISREAKKRNKKTASLLADMHADLGKYSYNLENREELREFLEKEVIDMILNNEQRREVSISKEKQIGFYSELLNKIQTFIQYQQEERIEDEEEYKKKILEYMEQLTIDPNNPDMIELQQYCNKLLQYESILTSEGEQLYSKLNHLSYMISFKKNSITNLTKDVRQVLQDIINDKAKTETITVKSDNGKTLTINGKKLEDKKNYINDVIRILLPEKQDLPLERKIEELNQLIKNHLDTISQRKEIITVSTEHKSALSIAQLTEAVHAAVDGYLNGKNDATIKTIGVGFLQDNNGDDIKLNSELQKKIKDTMEEDKNLFSKAYKFYIQKKYQDPKKSSTFDIVAQTKAQTVSEQLEIKHLQEAFAEDGIQIKDIRALFQIDDSAKFAETFMTQEGGFHGGSLGSDVLSQIENINAMLEMGGITPLDAKRLMSMVLNAGPALIGDKMRPALEKYFTTVGSMLMFRSGGNAILEWRNQVQNKYNNSMTKIHVYQFGPLVVPESYVLKKTYDNLKECVNLLEMDAKEEGSRVKIYNPVTEKDISKVDGVPSWSKTAEDNYPKVSLEMVLMGGFLDLMENMLAKMNSFS